ncbi:hypothetical protein JCM10212_000480 [Sporobolomyces blumeae]
MPDQRPRSSTVTSVSSTNSRPGTPRQHLVTNPTHLVTPSDHLEPATYDSPWDSHISRDVARSYRSEHSLKTIRPSTGDDDDDDDDNGNDGVHEGLRDSKGEQDGLDSGHESAAARHRPFVIDLDSSSTSNPNRPRSSTFGGVELPPAPPHPTLVLERDPVGLEPTDSPDLGSRSARSHADDDDESVRAGLLPRPALAVRGRSTSVSSLSSLRSLDPSLHLGGAPLKERRPVLYAGLQAGALLLVSVLALYLVLKGLLPPIDDEHKDKVKLPKSFDDLKALNEVLQVYKDRNYWRVLGCYCTVYLFLQAFSVPGSMYLSILGGALYGVLVALPLVCTCVATGALLCYFISAALGPAVLLHSEVWQKRVDAWTERVQSHRENLVSYLIVIRIAPLPPHWVVNVVAPHLGISMWTFWISTFLGIAGVSYIHTQIGTTLDQMTSSSDFNLISWQNGLGLGGIILAVLIPVLLRRMYRNDLSEAAQDPAGPSNQPRHSFDPLLAPRTSLSLDGDVRTSLSMTDGSARIERFHDRPPPGGREPPRTRADEAAVQAHRDGTQRPVLKEGAGSAAKVSKLLGVQIK